MAVLSVLSVLIAARHNISIGLPVTNRFLFSHIIHTHAQVHSRAPIDSTTISIVLAAFVRHKINH